MSEHCDRYTAETDTADIDVEYCDGDEPERIEITVARKRPDGLLCDDTIWLTCDEARQIAMGIVTVVR